MGERQTEDLKVPGSIPGLGICSTSIDIVGMSSLRKLFGLHPNKKSWRLLRAHLIRPAFATLRSQIPVCPSCVGPWLLGVWSTKEDDFENQSVTCASKCARASCLAEPMACGLDSTKNGRLCSWLTSLFAIGRAAWSSWKGAYKLFIGSNPQFGIGHMV